MIAELIGRIGWPKFIGLLALVAAPILSTTYMVGHTNGTADANAKHYELFNEQLVEQIEKEREAHSKQLQALQTKTSGEREAESIRDITLPDGALCSAGDDWLHAIQDGIDRANRAGRTTGTAARTD